MKAWKQNAILFGMGAIGYGLIEMMARGHTHWTMLLTGGACATALYHAHRGMRRRSWWMRCMLGAAIVTAAEFCVGMLVNRMLHWNVWDYSDRYMNVLGQICPRFTAYWFLLNLPLGALFARLDARLFRVLP